MFKKSIWSRKFLLLFFAILGLLISTNLTSAIIPDVRDKTYSSGDAHIHTEYSILRHSGSRDAFSSIIDQYNAAKEAGLDWITITDHSDFVFYNRLILGYMTDEGWNYQRTKVNEIYDFPVLLGEEITIGNGENLKTEGHLLAYGISDFVPTVSSSYDTTRKDGETILNEMGSYPNLGLGYIAHPYQFGTKHIDAEPWRRWDLLREYEATIKGFEILHSNHDAPNAALNLWDRLLKQKKKFFVIGNSDSHFSWGPGPQPGEAFTYTRGFADEPQILTALTNGYLSHPMVLMLTSLSTVKAREKL